MSASLHNSQQETKIGNFMKSQKLSPISRELSKFPGIAAGNFWRGGFPGIPELEFPVALFSIMEIKPATTSERLGTAGLKSCWATVIRPSEVSLRCCRRMLQTLQQLYWNTKLKHTLSHGAVWCFAWRFDDLNWLSSIFSKQQNRLGWF